MTLKQLENYKGIKAEIFSIESRIKDCISRSATIDGLPRGGGVTKPTEESAIKLAKLRQRYDARLNELIAAEKEITEWVYSLDDFTVQTYVIMKYIECRSNTDIEETLFYHRTTLARKLSQYLE